MDRGYHSNATMLFLKAQGIRGYVPEPDWGRRRWKNKRDAQLATYGNRRRTTGARGKALQRKRGELLERTFAHALETGAMRRVHLSHHDNILERMLIHVGAFDLSLIMREVLGHGTPRGLAIRLGRIPHRLLRFALHPFNPLAPLAGSAHHSAPLFPWLLPRAGSPDPSRPAAASHGHSPLSAP